jgi:hypothetical protein
MAGLRQDGRKPQSDLAGIVASIALVGRDPKGLAKE